ncbi:hypothetical protein [Elongatibacter sediminis]|uniref:hypothetical protein n=1 Tax=Elongatibacter sediminis TaxID=3119006 RepID=UPI00339D6C62
MGDEPGTDATGFTWFNEWKGTDGQVSLAAARNGGAYLLRFPDLADFHIGSDLGTITVRSAQNAAQDFLAHLLIDQVIPRVLNQKGLLVVHASAVALPCGRVIAFVGRGGLGKSTLAAALVVRGSKLVTDDCLVLDRESGAITGRPPYGSLRLWPDSIAALFDRNNAFRPISESAEKFQWIPETRDSGSSAHALSALFVLDEPDADGGPEQPRMVPLSGSGASMAIIESLFVLDIDNADVVGRNVRGAAALVASRLPVFRFSYTRRYESLAAACGFVEAQAQAASGMIPAN